MSGAATAPGQDPSMEDILASIRKILNEEETPESAGEPLELTEAMLVAAPPEKAEAQPAPEPDPAPQPEDEPEALAEVAAPPAPTPPGPVQPAILDVSPAPEPSAPEAPAPIPPAAPAPVAPAADLAEGLVAPATAAAAAALLGQLARTVAAERVAPVHRNGPSIEDVVREEVRPLLKEWMDAHLPALMERLVRAEIERVVSRSLG
jgi:hypothetical protein